MLFCQIWGGLDSAGIARSMTFASSGTRPTNRTEQAFYHRNATWTYNGLRLEVPRAWPWAIWGVKLAPSIPGVAYGA